MNTPDEIVSRMKSAGYNTEAIDIALIRAMREREKSARPGRNKHCTRAKVVGSVSLAKPSTITKSVAMAYDDETVKARGRYRRQPRCTSFPVSYPISERGYVNYWRYSRPNGAH
jgi:hypothetical protein